MSVTERTTDDSRENRSVGRDEGTLMGLAVCRVPEEGVAIFRANMKCTSTEDI